MTLSHGFIDARVPPSGLRGANILLEFPSVGATENALMAAVLAKGTTVIDNAAREPEIADLAAFLNRMGARIVGRRHVHDHGRGRRRAGPCEHTVIPDRIEAATFLAALGVAGGEITLAGARPDHMDMLVHKLGEMGMRISPCPEGSGPWRRPACRPSTSSTLPYPGIATDYKPLLVGDAGGGRRRRHRHREHLPAGRFRYVDELVRMGADIRTEGHHAVVRGVRAALGRAGAGPRHPGRGRPGRRRAGAPRARPWSADAHHIDRGYERFVEKLAALGADLERK